MQLPVVTPLYAGLLGLILVALAYRCASLRMRHKVSLGDGGVPALSGAIRAHGNFVEYVPLALILILLTELSGQGQWLVHVLGGALVAARVLHAQGISTKPGGKSFGRFWGILLTWLVIAAAAVTLIVRYAVLATA